MKQKFVLLRKNFVKRNPEKGTLYQIASKSRLESVETAFLHSAPHSTQRRLSNPGNSAILDTVDRRMTKPKESHGKMSIVTANHTLTLIRH